MRVLLIAALLLTAGVALLPEASAKCEDNPAWPGEYCNSSIPQRVDEIRSEACFADPLGLYCE